MEPEEALALQTTKKAVLEYMTTAEEWKGHPATERAALILESRKAKKRVELIDKLLLAGRLHPDFNVIGALSSRMSGAGGVNTQGIDHTHEIRSCFLLADPHKFEIRDGELVETDEPGEHILCGGDFKSFEVSLAAKVFADPGLDRELMSGRKIHAMLAMEIFPGKSYEEICQSEGTSFDMYDKGKKGVFLMFYGGDANTFKNRLGIELEIAERADSQFKARFPGIARFGREVFQRFGSLVQVGGIGSAIKWREPEEFAETFLGFRRYFTLENRITRTLFDLAQKPPPAWRTLRVSVRRRDRVQTAAGAVQSALYGAAFQISAGIERAAKNHYIQSPGAEITKSVQRVIWDVQPSGVNTWVVQPMNVHDEVMNVTRRGYESIVEDRVKERVAEYKRIVPLLAIDWFNGIPNWANKKHGLQPDNHPRVNVHDRNVSDVVRSEEAEEAHAV
jgi:DNA polymerase I-like protein with 3'-5' exonuclease and polymerase domains